MGAVSIIVLFHIILQLHILQQLKYIVVSGKQFQTLNQIY